MEFSECRQNEVIKERDTMWGRKERRRETEETQANSGFKELRPNHCERETAVFLCPAQ